MFLYDPERAPDPAQWLALDEQSRIRLAEEHHRAARVKLPNLKAHAVFHAIVENQIAEGHASVVRAMARLASQGLSRHNALHAIASVLAGHIQALYLGGADTTLSTADYDAALDRLTARSWRKRKP